MSEPVAREQIESILKEYVRNELNQKTHIVDLSLESLRSANAVRNTNKKYNVNWQEFISAVEKLVAVSDDLLKATEYVNTAKGSTLIKDTHLLVCKNFNTARAIITKACKSIPNNPDFGIAFRTRNFLDIQGSRSLRRAAGSQFLIFDNGKYQIHKVEKLSDTGRYALNPIEGFEDIKEVWSYPRTTSTNLVRSTNLQNFANLEVEISADNKIVIRKRLLSVLDIGHGEKEGEENTTPVGSKIAKILALGNLSDTAKAFLAASLKELQNTHNYISYKFENTSTDIQASGYIVVTVQNYNRNNLISLKESKILAKIKANIAKISGSNTIEEDAIEILQNKYIAALTNKPVKKIKKHNPVKGKTKTNSKVAGYSSGKNSVERQTKILAKSKPTKKVINIGLDLLNLQNLINSMLTQRVKENMGSGNRRDILNLRTGRFAESVKVERMSESRQGMITAFYTYMKNPYATFSEGGRQEFPRSRDPKLLISKSIRDIAAQQVANKLRAVSL